MKWFKGDEQTKKVLLTRTTEKRTRPGMKDQEWQKIKKKD